MALDAHEIAPGLWQGSRPKTGSLLADAGFTTLVLCAMEHQPSSTYFPGVKVIHAPFDDGPYLIRQDLETAMYAASKAAVRMLKGEKILVTCFAGINRSGLVVALILHKVFGYSGRTCIDIVREKRKLEDGDTPLRNPAFVEALSKLSGDELIVLPGLEPIRVTSSLLKHP